MNLLRRKMAKPRKKKVSFWATKKVPVRKRVSFRRTTGERVSFTGKKYVPKRLKVSFWASRKGKRIRRRR